MSAVSKSNKLYYLYPYEIKQWLAIFIIRFPATQRINIIIFQIPLILSEFTE